MQALKLPSGKILNREFFNEIVCISTVLELNEKGKSEFPTNINYIINITFPGSNYVTLAYEDKKLAIADLYLIEKYLIPECAG